MGQAQILKFYDTSLFGPIGNEYSRLHDMMWFKFGTTAIMLKSAIKRNLQYTIQYTLPYKQTLLCNKHI